jgi:predicted dehydrogenase
LIKCLVIGFGSAGSRHADNAQILGYEVRIVSSRFIDKYYCYNDYLKAINDFNPDCIIIASNTADHLGHLQLAMNNAIPALIEKPLAPGYNSFKSGITIQNDSLEISSDYRVGYLMRYHPLVVKTKERIAELGTINYVKLEFGQYLPMWRPDRNYMETYSANREQGGGVLLDSSHEIDLVQNLFGDVKEIQAQVRNSGQLQIDSEDIIIAIMCLENNILVNLSLDYLSQIPERRMRIEGENGTIVVDFINNTYSEIIKEKEIVEQLTINRNDIFKEELFDFVENRSACLLPDLNESLHILKIFDAVWTSSKTGKWVSV